MKSIYFPDISYSSEKDREAILSRYHVINSFCYSENVVAAIIRPPEIYSRKFKEYFPNLRLVLSDTTGVSHLRGALGDPGLVVKTLRDVDINRRKELTAAADHAFSLIMLAMRPTIRAVLRLSAGEFNQDAMSCRKDYIGYAWQDMRVGIIGLGRIGTIVASMIPSYCKELGYYDINKLVGISDIGRIQRHDSLESLVTRSDIILISVTDDDANYHFISSKILALGHLQAIINISRPYVVDEEALMNALDASLLNCYYSDFLMSIDMTRLKPYLLDGRIVCLPHMGGCTFNSWKNSLSLIISLLNHES